MHHVLSRVLLVGAALLLGACVTSQGLSPGNTHTAFDTGDWDRGAVEEAEVAERASETPERRQLAEYRVGVGLQRAGLPAAGASLLKEIAGSNGHAAHGQALSALLALALELPAAADVQQPLLPLDEEARKEALKDLPSPVRSRLRFLLGRFEYENSDYPKARAELEKVEGADLPRALMLTALCHVNERKSVPAVAALEKALGEAARLPAPEAQQMIDLANLLMAQTFFSVSMSAVKVERRMVVVDRKKAAAALKYWNKIDVASPLAPTAQWQRAWLELALGDQKAALADARAARGAPGAFLPEAEEIEATVRWGMGETEPAMEGFRAFSRKYSPVHAGLVELLAGLAKGSDPNAAAFALLEQAHDHPEQIAETVRLPVTQAVTDRRVLDDLEYGRLLAKETSRLDASPVLRDSKAGARARGALERERKALLRQAGARVLSRLKDTTELLGTLLKEVGEAVASDSAGAPSPPAP